MKAKTFFRFGWVFLVLSMCSVVALLLNIPWAQAEECIPDTQSPFLSITAPATGGGYYETTQPLVDLRGRFDDDTGVTRVEWSNNLGGSGTAEATMSDWTGHWDWKVNGIPLQEGNNVITVTARDAAGNTTASFLTVSYAAASCIPDTQAPFLSITAPAAGGGYYETTQPLVDLRGRFDDDIGVTRVEWSNNLGGSGTAEATMSDWTGHWDWKVNGIPLQEGNNVIAVTARDAAGNNTTESLTVSYSTTTPPSSVRSLENRKAKFTYFLLSEGIDRFSIYTYLSKESDQVFLMPFDKDVTVTVTIPDPRNPAADIQLFSQVIAAGTVSDLEKYRYVSGPGGIRELTFQNSTDTQTYMYVYVEEVDLLPEVKPTLSEEDYLAFVRTIGSYTITVKIDNIVWRGDAPLVPGFWSEYKQELVYNR